MSSSVAAVGGPDVAVGAVVLAELPLASDPTKRSTHVVLVQRAHPPLAGRWTLPGGRVRRGETLVEALRREVQEETALVVDVGPLVEVVEIVEAEYHYVIMDYLTVFSGEARTLCAGDDAADARWVALEDVVDFGVTAAVRRVIASAVAMR